MANTFYDKARERFATAQINWNTDTIKAQLVDAGAYTVNGTSHEFLSDVPVGARIGAPVTLTGKTALAGAMDADNTQFTGITGPTIEAVVIYKDGGTDGTSPVIVYLDTGSGLPITPNTGDIILTWDNGTNKIFRL